MTIDLGYAYLPLKEKVLGLLMYLAMKVSPTCWPGLVVCIMPCLLLQPMKGLPHKLKEHLAILHQLQFTEIMVVITKADRATNEQIEALKTQIQTDYPFLAESHYFITSAQTGLGIDALRDYLANLLELAEINKPFRYAIDRVFSVKGLGQ